MKKSFTLLLAIMTVLVLAACTANKSAGEDEEEESSDSTETSNDEKVLYLNNGTEPTSFDPPIGFDSSSWGALNNLMEGLTRLGQDDQPEEAIAESWNISDDGTEYTFQIREDATWSNGDDLTAGDFVFSWKRMLDPEVGASSAFLGYFIKGAEAFNSGEGSVDNVAVVAEDEKTLKVTLESPAGFFLNVISLPAFFPINEAVATENPEWFADAETFIGNGPFKLESWTHDTELVMVKNDQYWDADTVKLDKVHWAMVNDSNTEYQMYESGDLDTSAIPADMAEEILSDDDVIIEDQAGTYFYRFVVDKEPFQNAKIRKAIAMAVDRQQIVEYVTKNGEEPAYGFVAPGFTDPSGQDFREANGNLVEFNPDEATALLEEGMAEEGYDELPAITLSYNTSDSHKAIAETIQQMLKQNLGIDVTLENAEWNVFLEDQKALNHQLSRSSFLHDYADPINALESFVTDSSMNRTGWSNVKYDEFITNAKAATDEQQRYDYMYQAEQLLFEEMPIFPIHYYNQVVLQNPSVTDIIRHPVGYLELKWADKTE